MKIKLLKELAQELKKFLTKASDRWIEPDDSRYTDIISEYESKLSEHWRNTRDEYISKIKTKNLEIDDSVEQYDIDVEYTDYIETALEIIALAFGLGVLVGYNEIISRGIEVEIPENPEELFDEAKEIKNYVHAALTNEQNDMDEILALYLADEEAKQKIQEWFDKNESRLTERVLGGVVWYGIQFGFARAAIESESTQIFLYWITERDRKVCKDCQTLQDNSPYHKDNPLTTLPGGGKTVCGSSCRCVIETREK